MSISSQAYQIKCSQKWTPSECFISSVPHMLSVYGSCYGGFLSYTVQILVQICTFFKIFGSQFVRVYIISPDEYCILDVQYVLSMLVYVLTKSCTTVVSEYMKLGISRGMFIPLLSTSETAHLSTSL